MLAFPSNDFHQELESNNAIQEFIKDEFPSTNFPVFGMSSLADNPVYKQLRKQLPDDGVRHNFFKYLVDRKGIARQLFPKARDPLTYSKTEWCEMTVSTRERKSLDWLEMRNSKQNIDYHK